MFAQDRPQLGVKQVGGGVITHDISPSLRVQVGDGRVAQARLALDDLSSMYNHPGRVAAGILHLDFPGRFSSGEDHTCIRDLASCFHVKTGLGKEHFYQVSWFYLRDALPVAHQGQHCSLYIQSLVWIVDHTLWAEQALRLQLRQHPEVDINALIPKDPEGFSSPRGLAVVFQGRLKSGFIDLQALLSGNIAGDLQR